MHTDEERMEEESLASFEDNTDAAPEEVETDIESDDDTSQILDSLKKYEEFREDEEDEVEEPENEEVEEVEESPEDSESSESSESSEQVEQETEEVEETETEEVAETEETEDTEEAKAEEEPHPLENSTIPYKRFREVVQEKNLNKADAIVWRDIRKAYTEAGITDESYRMWSQLGITVNTKPQAAVPYIKHLAESVGLKVVESVPDELRTLVDQGEITESAAEKLARQRYAAQQELESTLPSFEPASVDPTEALKEVGQSYMERFPAVFQDESNIKFVLEDIDAQKAEYEAVYGSEIPAERLAILADRACQKVVKKTRTKPPETAAASKPLRASKPQQKSTGTGSIRDFVRNNPYLKNL